MSDSEVFETAIKMLKVKTEGTDINATSIIKIMQTAMEVVEITEVKGKEQKDLAIKLVRQLVVDAPIHDEKEKLLLDMIDNNILGDTIDLVISASKGELDINKIVAVSAGCCGKILAKKNDKI